MDAIYSALFEGGLLFNAGMPVVSMYQQILSAYADEPEVSALFKDLAYDWDHPTASPLKMVMPFKIREHSDSGFVLASAYTEIAAATTMVDPFWEHAGMAYLLQKHVRKNTPSKADGTFATELLGVFASDHPLRQEFGSWSKESLWQAAIRASDPETSPDFMKWSRQFPLSKIEPLPFRSRTAIEDHIRGMGLPDLLDELLTENLKRWELFSRVLVSGYRCQT